MTTYYLILIAISIFILATFLIFKIKANIREEILIDEETLLLDLDSDELL